MKKNVYTHVQLNHFFVQQKLIVNKLYFNKINDTNELIYETETNSQI